MQKINVEVRLLQWKRQWRGWWVQQRY